jgi:hypothetical protein
MVLTLPDYPADEAKLVFIRVQADFLPDFPHHRGP